MSLGLGEWRDACCISLPPKKNLNTKSLNHLFMNEHYQYINRIEYHAWIDAIGERIREGDSIDNWGEVERDLIAKAVEIALVHRPDIAREMIGSSIIENDYFSDDLDWDGNSTGVALINPRKVLRNRHEGE